MHERVPEDAACHGIDNIACDEWISFALAKFFFHHRGSEIDRSFKGLLRALLLQILEAFPQLC
jgi:hypothetical protein